jgi:hypothetical protein
MAVFYVLGLALVDAQIALYDNLVGSSVRLLQVCTKRDIYLSSPYLRVFVVLGCFASSLYCTS